MLLTTSTEREDGKREYSDKREDDKREGDKRDDGKREDGKREREKREDPSRSFHKTLPVVFPERLCHVADKHISHTIQRTHTTNIKKGNRRGSNVIIMGIIFM